MCLVIRPAMRYKIQRYRTRNNSVVNQSTKSVTQFGISLISHQERDQSGLEYTTYFMGEESRRIEGYFVHASFDQADDEAEQVRAVSRETEHAIYEERMVKGYSEHARHDVFEEQSLDDKDAKELQGKSTTKPRGSTLGFLDWKYISEEDVSRLEKTHDFEAIQR